MLDEPACAALTNFFTGILPPTGEILDLMSKLCVSFATEKRSYYRRGRAGHERN